MMSYFVSTYTLEEKAKMSTNTIQSAFISGLKLSPNNNQTMMSYFVSTYTLEEKAKMSTNTIQSAFISGLKL